MIKEMYALKDNKVDAFGTPMFTLKEDLLVAELRIFLHAQKQKEEINPVDYDLFFLGKYDTEKGTFEMPEAPKHILNCRTLETKEN